VPDKDLPVILPKMPSSPAKALSTRRHSGILSTPPARNAAVRAPGNRHDGHFRRFLLVFLSLLRPQQRQSSLRSAKVAYWFPIDQYIGGITHAILHTALFAFLVASHARHWSRKARRPIARLFTQGMVQKGGRAMSKSKGNVVGAMEMAEKYGADTGRLYTLFAAPPEKDLEWSEKASKAPGAFINRGLSPADRYRILRDIKSGIPPQPPIGKKNCSARPHPDLRRVLLWISKRAGTSFQPSLWTWISESHTPCERVCM